METMAVMGLILLALVVVCIGWFISVYNKFVQLKALVDEAWSGIDVQLKRRYDLIPNLVAVVKQYSVHEKEVLEKITSMRAVSMGATTIEQKSAAENGLTGALKTLFAVAENYPDLKANQGFLQLQKDLSVLEDDVQLARRYYNGAARNYNIMIAAFPSSIVANMNGFKSFVYFQVDATAERQAPSVKF